MERNDSILGGALLLTAANLLLRLISIAFQVFLSVRIGAAGLGLMQLISTIGVFAMLAGTAGVRVTAMYLAAEEFGHRRLSGVRAAMRACLQYGILVSAVSGAALFFLSDFFAMEWLRDLRAGPSLRVMGLLLPFSCLCGIMTGYYTACSRIRQLVGIEIAERLVSVGLTVILLYLWAGDDLARACCAITFGSSAGCIFDFTLLYLRYRRDMRQVPREHIPMRKRLLRLSVPLALNDALRAGLNTAEQLLIPIGLARYGGSTEEAMAGYGTIHGMVFPILMFPAAILYSVSDLLVPELSRCRAMGRGLRVRDLSGKCIRMTILFAAAVAGFFFVCAEELGQCVYHSADAGRYLRIFAPMVLMLYLDAIVDGMLKGLAEQLSCVRSGRRIPLCPAAAPWRCGLCGGVCRDACHQSVFEHPAAARCDGAPAAHGGFCSAAAEPRPCPAADASVPGGERMACAAPVPRRLVPDGFARGLCAAAGPDAAGRQLAAARAAPDA